MQGSTDYEISKVKRVRRDEDRTRPLLACVVLQVGGPHRAPRLSRIWLGVLPEGDLCLRLHIQSSLSNVAQAIAGDSFYSYVPPHELLFRRSCAMLLAICEPGAEEEALRRPKQSIKLILQTQSSLSERPSSDGLVWLGRLCLCLGDCSWLRVMAYALADDRARN